METLLPYVGLIILGGFLIWFGLSPYPNHLHWLYIKSFTKKIRTESEWEENGFYPEFENIARYIVSKKKCRTLDLQKDLKLGFHGSKLRMMQLEQANIVDIEIRTYTYVSKTGEKFPSDFKWYFYKRVVNSQKNLDKVLQDMESLKENVMTRDEISKSFDEESEKDNKVDDSCYLYLMKDFNTGFHKIGISNSPEHREKTLQSEKPTIEMVCNKKYSSRRMARSFEQALHKTFSEKRVRGEWFDLDISDVEEIESTLNS